MERLPAGEQAQPRRHIAALSGRHRAMAETYDFLFKFLVIGSAGTGKSCLLHQFIENKCEFLAGPWAIGQQVGQVAGTTG